MANITIANEGYGFDNLIATHGYGTQLAVYPFDNSFSPSIQETKTIELNLSIAVQYEQDIKFDTYIPVKIEYEYYNDLELPIFVQQDVQYDINLKIDNQKLRNILSLL